jgi:4'-phosphopantetheinyl transferase EntD
MFERLLPPEISCHAVRDDPAEPALFPEEAALIDGAVDRRREFAAGRWCAHHAIAGLGLSPGPVLRGPKREPLWPSGLVGSITHCRGLRAAAVAFREHVQGIGIDAEPDGPMPAGVGRRVLCDEERSWLARAPAGVNWERLIFSAKESVYKAWFPLTGRWLGFDEAIVTFDLLGSFEAQVLTQAPPALRVFRGRFAIADGLVLTAVAV